MLSLSPSYPTTKTSPAPPPSLVFLRRTSIPVNVMPKAVPMLLCAVNSLLNERRSFPAFSKASSAGIGSVADVYKGSPSAPLAFSAFSQSPASVAEGKGEALPEVLLLSEPKAFAFSWSRLYCASTWWPKRRYWRKDCITKGAAQSRKNVTKRKWQRRKEKSHDRHRLASRQYGAVGVHSVDK